MRIKEGYELKNCSGQYVIVCGDREKCTLENSIVLTNTAVFLWNLLKEREVTKTEMLSALIENFEISTVLALGNIDVFVRTLKENGIIEE